MGIDGSGNHIRIVPDILPRHLTERPQLTPARAEAVSLSGISRIRLTRACSIGQRPWSRIPCLNASTKIAKESALPLIKNPITGTLGRCAYAESGHAIAVPQRAPRKSRRFKKADALLCIFVVITQCLLNQASEGGDSGS
jgi:hypothetical protein